MSKGMTRRTRCNQSTTFKAQVAMAAIKGDIMLAELALHFDVHPNKITDWKSQLQERAARVCGEQSGLAAPEPELRTLHAKIGGLTLENEFLEGALAKAGLLSAKR